MLNIGDQLLVQQAVDSTINHSYILYIFLPIVTVFMTLVSVITMAYRAYIWHHGAFKNGAAS